jgi:hypothetical protein
MAGMLYSVEGYEARAQECAGLANQADDQLVRMELLKLRQSYLEIAQRLRRHGFEIVSSAEDKAQPRPGK